MFLGLNCGIWIDLFQTLAVIVTLIFLIKYTKATVQQKNETVKQTNLIMRPFVVVAFEERVNRYKLINYGQTIALNVQINDIPLIEKEELVGTGSMRDLSIKYIFPSMMM